MESGFLHQLVQQLINGISLGSIYALIALGYTMIYGILKLINFAHGDIYMLGAYIGFVCTSILKLSFLPALIISMIAGRVVWGIARLILAGLSGNSFTWALFIAGAVTNAIPGIILHIVLIPVLVMVMERAGLSLNKAK